MSQPTPPVQNLIPKKHRLPALDGVRFLAALSIVLGHAWGEILKFDDYPSISSFGGIISLYGMPIFFVLSGFVIHYNYAESFKTMRTRWAICEFFSARVARIYPLFIASVFVGFSIQGIFLWLGRYDMPFALLTLHNLTLTQSWFYQIMFERLMLYFGFGMGWSISNALFFYITFVVLVIPLGRWTSPRRLLIAVCVYVTAVIGLLISIRNPITHISASYLHVATEGPSGFPRWFFYFSPYANVFEFVLGCITAQMYLIVHDREPSSWEINAGFAIVLFSLGLMLLAASSYSIDPSQPIAAIANHLKENFGLAVPIAVIIFSVVFYPSPLATMLASRPMVLLGERSYSIYAVHVLMIILFARPASAFTQVALFEAFIRLCLVITFTLILASATYRLIEVPARAGLRRFFEQRIISGFGTRTENVGKGEHQWATVLRLALIFAAVVALCIWYQFKIIPLYGTII
ncbi:MAG TPA: acyltransferase [Xanthobacteraceae bacterium]|nr:acyltransferase [Xanthobacteraceae bacterium]